MTSDPEILLHNIKHHCELGEDEDPVIVVFHRRKYVVENRKLSAVADLVVAQAEVLDTLKRN